MVTPAQLPLPEPELLPAPGIVEVHQVLLSNDEVPVYHQARAQGRVVGGDVDEVSWLQVHQIS